MSLVAWGWFLPAENLNVEEDVLSAVDHVELGGGQHDLADGRWTGAHDDNCEGERRNRSREKKWKVNIIASKDSAEGGDKRH